MRDTGLLGAVVAGSCEIRRKRRALWKRQGLDDRTAREIIEAARSEEKGIVREELQQPRERER